MRRTSQLEGSREAAFAANGINASFGSASQVLDDTVNLDREDVQTVYTNTANEVQGFDISAANYRSQASAARARGNAALTGSLFGAGGTILGGVSQYA